MSIRNKTKRRLLILFTIVLAMTGTTVGLIAVQRSRTHAQAAEHRELAITATKEHRYSDALSHFNKAWRVYRDDPELFYYFAVARRHVPLPNGRHLEEAIGRLDQAIKLKPDYMEAMGDLLQLYTGVLRDTEALVLADRVLAIDPGHNQAIRSKVLALVRLRRFDEALTAAHEGIRHHPEESRLYELAINAMRQAGRPGHEMIDFATKALEQRPDDPRFKRVLAYAHGSAGDPQKAQEILVPLAEEPAPDASYVEDLVVMFDGIERFDLSTHVLEVHAPKFNEPGLQRLLIRRLWEGNRFNDVIKASESLDPSSAATPAMLVGLRAMSLMRAGNLDGARPLVEALEKRADDPAAAAWAPLLRHTLDEPQTDGGRSIQTLKKSVELLKAARNKDPDNPYVLYSLGDAYIGLGEKETALDFWSDVVGTPQRPGPAASWFLPFLRIAQVHGELGRHNEAVRAAQAAFVRAPHLAVTHLARIDALYQAINAGLGTSRGASTLLRMVEEYRRHVPQDQLTLAMYIDLLVRTNERDRALQELKVALADESLKLGEQTLAKLSTVSRRHDLGLERQIIDRQRAAFGLTPQTALAWAEHLMATEGREAAISYMDSALKEVGNEASSAAWQLAWARTLEAAQDPRARDAWIRILDEHTDDLTVQRMALNVRLLQADRQIMEKVIDRLKQVTGPSGIAWRLAEARLHLGEDATDNDLSRASQSLKDLLRISPNLLEARVLLADAQRRMGLLAEATAQLTQVAAARPGNVSVLLQLAQLRIEQGDFSGARADLRSLSDDGLSDTQSLQLASLLMTVGEDDRATALLEEEFAQDSAQVQAGLMLVRAYLRAGHRDKAQSVFAKLMERPAAPVITAYADYLANTGRYDEAVRVLDRIDEAEITPANRSLARFGFYRKRVDRVGLDKVLGHLRAAMEAEPRSVLPRRLMLGMYIDMNDIEGAMRAASEAHQVMPDDPVFSLFQAEPEMLRFALGDAMLRPIAESAIADDQYRGAAVQAMRVVYRARLEKAPAPQVTQTLRRMTEQYPRMLAIQNLLIDWYASLREYEQAASLAQRTLNAFPSSPAPAEKAARLYDAMRQWDRVVPAAREWRNRNPADAMPADIFIAQALLNQGQSERAISTVQPYLQSALAEPENYPEVVTIYAAALVKGQKAAQAAEILEPLLPKAARWRQVWISLAGGMIGDPATSQNWLERVMPLLPADGELERVALAQAWADLARRSGKPELLESAVKVLEPMARNEQAQPQTLIAWGVLRYQQMLPLRGDAAQAPAVARMTAESEDAYRRALARSPDALVALNNLAMLLAERPEARDEALKLAQRAVELQPDNASFLDTLAFVQARRKDYSAAIRTLERAVQIEPLTIEWRINLALAHLHAGQKDQARTLLQEIETQGSRIDRLDGEARQRLEELRTGLTEQAAAGQAP